jgi:pilus assembly protein CpaE
MRKTTVLINGRDAASCSALHEALDNQPDLELAVRVSTPDQWDPLRDISTMPDVLIVALDKRWEETLRALAVRPASSRPPTLMVGTEDDPQVMRRAMQIGARDYFMAPVPRNELLQTVRLIRREQGVEAVDSTRGSLTAVINAKGGSGASFIATNLAHIMAVQGKAPVALIDLDLQFGALPLALDLEARNSLMDALEASEQLDPMALQGHMARHKSGVHVLSAMSEQLPLPWEISTDALAKILTVARQTYAEVVVDLPRQIDPLTSLVLSQASHIVLVMQQSLAHVRDAQRMFKVITGSLSVPRDRVVVVINRQDDHSTVQVRDIVETLNPPSHVMLPNDFNAVTESLNVGVPLLEFDRTVPLARALQELAARFMPLAAEPEAEPKRRGLRAALAGTFGRSRS